MRGIWHRMNVGLIVAVLTFTIAFPPSAVRAMNTQAAGGGQPHNNRQPYLGLNHIVRLQGTFDELGEIGLFAGNFAPQGWAFADGQLLSIASSTSLFSKLGTTYGGDGRTTFALPDLRGRAMIGEGTGAGLTPRSLGASVGTDVTLLAVNQIPSHNHDAEDPVITDFTGGGQSHNNMAPSLALSPWIATQGLYPSRNAEPASGVSPAFGISGSIPFIGEVVYTSSAIDMPNGWERADGQLLQIASNTALFSLLGTTYGGDGRTTFALPDLAGRAAVHAGTGPGLTPRPLGAEFGVEEVTLGIENLPSHAHGGVPTSDGFTEPTGGSQSHENMQPSEVINYIIALQGLYPSRSSAGDPQSESPQPAAGSGSEPYLGSISMFAGNFAPRGWALADGQLLPISQNQSLFSLLGTTYGGDGRTTFGLPDLRGRTPVHLGTGSGLSPISWGQKSGEERVTLTTFTMPSHTHLFADMPGPGDANGDGHVNGDDYLLWAGNFGTHPGPDGDVSDGDFNDDGWVDGLDYLIWAGNYGSGPFDAAAVPEPSTLMLALLVLAEVVGFVRQPRR